MWECVQENIIGLTEDKATLCTCMCGFKSVCGHVFISCFYNLTLLTLWGHFADPHEGNCFYYYNNCCFYFKKEKKSRSLRGLLLVTEVKGRARLRFKISINYLY